MICKGGALPPLALHLDPTAVLLDDPVGDGQAQTRPHAPVFGRVEGVENPLLDLLRHARPIVGDGHAHAHLIVFTPRPHRDPALGIVPQGFGGVDQGGHHDLLELARGTRDGREGTIPKIQTSQTAGF